MRTIVNKLLINIQFLKFSLLLLKVKNKIIEKKKFTETNEESFKFRNI